MKKAAGARGKGTNGMGESTGSARGRDKRGSCDERDGKRRATAVGKKQLEDEPGGGDRTRIGACR